MDNTKPNQPKAPTSAPQPEPTSPPTPEPSHDAPKKSKSLITTTIICAILAIAGIAASIYFYIDANNKAADVAELQSKLNLLKEETGAELVEKQENDTTITTVEVSDGANISNDLAQNIVDPYLKNFTTFANLLDYGLNDETKVEVAYLNLSPRQIGSVEMYNEYSVKTFNISYDDLKREYQVLFGNNTELVKRDYDPGKTDSFTFVSGDRESFRVAPFYGGGTGGAIYSIVREAYPSDNNVVIEVYHGTIPWCTPEDDDSVFCYKGDITGLVTIKDGNMPKIISEKSDQIPVYKMIFSKDSDHYVLTDIQKQ